MRFLALCLALAACSSAEPVTPDASTNPDAPIADVAVDTAPDVAPADAPVDVTPDASPEASVDAASDVVRDAASDAQDATADARTCGSSFVLECDVQGSVMCVDIQRGRVIGDHIEHCGACGVVCRVGEVCLERRCQSI